MFMQSNISTIRVSTGSIIPHCDECNNLGPTTFALESNGKLIFS